MKHLIIGAGAAAISAVRTILKEKPEDSIIVVSQDEEVHSRCMLHKYISGERSAESLNFINDDILSSKKVQWIKGKTVSRLDGASKTVYSGEEKIASADTVLIASGANSIVPPIGELKNAKNVFSLRHLSDARGIVEYAKTAKKIAIIGSGLVGLDAASGIIESKDGASKEIHVIDMASSVLAVNLDAYAAGAYQKLFEKKGVQFHLGRRLQNTKSGGKTKGFIFHIGSKSSPDKINNIELDNGELIPCDMVIMAVGVSPSTAFLEGSGVHLTERKSIKVDNHLMTNVPGVYAAGDVAGLSAIWPNAQKQGEYAAYNMTGTKMAYDDLFTLKNTVNFFGLLSMSLGAIHP